MGGHRSYPYEVCLAQWSLAEQHVVSLMEAQERHIPDVHLIDQRYSLSK